MLPNFGTAGLFTRFTPVKHFHNISAIFFLCIFAVYGMHQLLPHEHHMHQKERVEHTAQVTQHSHGHDHSTNHHHHDNDPQEEEGLFGGLLDDHTHASEIVGFMLTNASPKQSLETKVILERTLGQSDYSIGLPIICEGNLTEYPPPQWTPQLILSSDHRRGPPTLA
jgi:hypothetical protein